MQINRGTEYAIRAAVFLAEEEERTPIVLADIAEGIGAPANYLSNILQSLTRFGIVQAHRGARRGYSLGRPAEEIDLLQIIEALEGPLAMNVCETQEPGDCPASGNCSVTQVFKDLQAVIKERLTQARLDVLRRPPCSREEKS